MFTDVNKFNLAVNDLRCSKSGLTAIDDIFKTMPIEQVQNAAHVNGVPFRSASKYFRMGEMNAGFRKLKMGEISVADKQAFKKILDPDVPDITFQSMKSDIAANGLIHADLKVMADSVEGIKKQLSSTAKGKVLSAWAKLNKFVGAGLPVIGIVAVAVLGSNAYSALHQATATRNGCFITYKQNGKVQSCKIMRKSCTNNEGPVQCGSNVSGLLGDNIYLFVMNAVQTNDANTLAAIKAKTGLDITQGNAANILSAQDSITKLLAYYGGLNPKPQIANPCEVAKVESGCVSCDPSAAFNSPTYIDDTDLPENMKISCITNSTILDTIIDFGTAIGVKLLGSIGGITNSFTPMFVWIVGITMAVILSVLMFLKFGRGKKDKVELSVLPPESPTSMPLSSSTPYSQQLFAASAPPPPYTSSTQLVSAPSQKSYAQQPTSIF